MSNKRKNTSIQSSWEETKAQLQQDFQFGWLNELSKVQTSLLSERDGLKKDAAEKKRVLDDQLQQEQSAFSQESNDVYKLVEKIQDLKADVADIEQAISEIRDVETEVRANIRLYKQEASQRLQEIDVVEMERMAEVPKIKNQISLYATTTGIKWDYNREHVLAGEVVSSLERFPHCILYRRVF